MLDWNRAFEALPAEQKRWLDANRDWRLPDAAPSTMQLSAIIIEKFARGGTPETVVAELGERGVTEEAAHAVIRMLETVLG